MGFVQKHDDDGDGGGDVIGTGQRSPTDPSEAHGWSGLEVDLDVRACATCRRELLPWQDRCPEDGGEAVRKADLPSREDALLDRYLRDNPDAGDDPDATDDG